MKVRIPRLYEWYLVAIALFVLLWHLRPQDMAVVAYKLDLVALAVVVGGLVEWRFFRDERNPIASAIVLAAIVLGITQGL